MVITEHLVKQFELEQSLNGTFSAMHNLLWRNADRQLKDLGVKRVTTTFSTRVRGMSKKKGKKKKKYSYA